MLRKVFLQVMFGSPHPWIRPYLAHLGRLEPTGWRWRIFTPNKLGTVPPNVDIVPMDIAEYDTLVEKACGVKVGNYINESGVPAKLTSDHSPAFGEIFADHIKDADYWGITNFDVVFGRLSRFLPDEELAKYDIWADEGCVAFNGIFTLMKNVPKVNRLYRQTTDWETSFRVHKPTAFDEHQFTRTLRAAVDRNEIAFGHPEHFGLHSYDRLIQHQPKPNLYFEPDGALIERYDDRTHFPARCGWHGRELFCFHFSRTKRWPL